MKCALFLFIVFALALAADPQITAVYDLIARVTSPEISKKFNLEIIPPERDGKDIFQIDATTVEDQVSLKGTDGTMLGYAFGQYLRYYCNSSRSWGEKDDGDHVVIPSPLPVVKETVRTKMLDEYRYYMNVCTFGYSYVWWDWTRWEKEIDWMILNGINIPLAFVGQEYVFGEVYKDMGLSEEEIVEHFTGIGFLPWNRMGNLRGWGGPLTEEVRYNEFLLNKKIVERELSLGMKPILPAFSGYVPEAMLKYYPNVTHSISPLWAGFNSTYSNIVLIEPSDPLFKEISVRFIRKQIYP